MKFLVIENDQTCREAICFLIEDEGHVANGLPWSEQVWAKLKEEPFDAVLMEVDLSWPDSLRRVGEVRMAHPDLQLVIVVVEQSLKVAAEAIRRGVVDILEKPFQREHLLMMIARLERFKQLSRKLAPRPASAETNHCPTT
jgi:DNA-binding NtrC family response regulator